MSTLYVHMRQPCMYTCVNCGMAVTLWDMVLDESAWHFIFAILMFGISDVQIRGR
jgi:hypothetical protein